MLREMVSRCPYCGERLVVEIDSTAGFPQEFTYDCVVCCRPIEVRVRMNDKGNPVMELRSEEDTA